MRTSKGVLEKKLKNNNDKNNNSLQELIDKKREKIKEEVREEQVKYLKDHFKQQEIEGIIFK